jgi:hypothetical protein
MNKKGNPIAGIFIGILFVIGGLILLWWNEGRTVKTESAIKEAEANYIDVESSSINKDNDGKLIASNGLQTREDKINDSLFGVIVDSSKMERVVEVYQWVEECSKDSDDVETCTYEKKWVDELVDSSDFKESTAHTNPTTMKYESKTFIAKNVKAGEFVIPEDMVKTLSTKENVVLSEDNDDQRYAEHQLGLKITEDGAYYTDVVNNTPEVGNTRVSFKYNNAPYVSFMGVQKGNTIEAYKAKSGYKIYHIYEGQHKGEAMIQMMRDSNRMIKIICRVVGILLVIIGLLSVISPIQKLASYVPILGSIFNGATTLIAIILGIALSLIDIGIAWVFYRPVLGICILVAAVALIVLSVILKKKNKKPEQQDV